MGHIGGSLELSANVTVDREVVNDAWDKLVEATPGGTYQQTSMWAQVKALVGWKPVRVIYSRDGTMVAGCQLLIHRVGKLGTVAYAPYGPLVADGCADDLSALLDALQQLVRAEGLRYLKLQPPPDSPDMTSLLTERQFIPSGLDAAPRLTVRVDLSRPPDAILGAMRARTRTNIRQARRRGASVREGTEQDLPFFCELVEATSRRQGFAPYPRAYYEKIWRTFHRRVVVLFAEYEGEILSGTMLLGFGNSVSYKMGAWSGCHRDVRPNELLHWAGMQWGSERGYRYYDLEGITPAVGEAILAGRDRKDLPVTGPAHAKLGLGGEVAQFPRSYDYAHSRMLRAGLRLVAPRLDRLAPIGNRLAGRPKAGP